VSNTTITSSQRHLCGTPAAGLTNEQTILARALRDRVDAADAVDIEVGGDHEGGKKTLLPPDGVNQLTVWCDVLVEEDDTIRS
jgi:hypothetical protein